MYITGRGRVRLVDFNPVGGTTAPLLFSDWAELGYGLLASHSTATAAAAGAAAASEPVAEQPAAAGAVADRLAAASLRDGGGAGSGSVNGVAHTALPNGSASPSDSKGGPLRREVDFRIIDEPVVMRSAAQVRTRIRHSRVVQHCQHLLGSRPWKPSPAVGPPPGRGGGALELLQLHAGEAAALPRGSCSRAPGVLALTAMVVSTCCHRAMRCRTTSWTVA